MEPMFSRFKNLVSRLKVLKQNYTTTGHVKRILRSSPRKYRLISSIFISSMCLIWLLFLVFSFILCSIYFFFLFFFVFQVFQRYKVKISQIGRTLERDCEKIAWRNVLNGKNLRALRPCRNAYYVRNGPMHSSYINFLRILRLNRNGYTIVIATYHTRIVKLWYFLFWFLHFSVVFLHV